MTDYRFVCAKKAKGDFKIIQKCTQKHRKLKECFGKMKKDPLCPTCEKLSNNLKGLYSRRLNKKDRLVYEPRKEKNVVIIERMLTHYEGLHDYNPMPDETVDRLLESVK